MFVFKMAWSWWCDCFFSCIYNLLICLRLMKRIDIIEPRNIDLDISVETNDPDYIPVYMEMTVAQPKYANMAP